MHPATCEREYTEEEIEVMKAVESYKKRKGIRFPTHCEILHIIIGLGYRKPSPV